MRSSSVRLNAAYNCETLSFHLWNNSDRPLRGFHRGIGNDLPSAIAVVVRSVVALLDSAPRRGGGNADSSSVTMLDRDKPHVYYVLVTCRSLYPRPL
jgi:hypothetical protein